MYSREVTRFGPITLAEDYPSLPEEVEVIFSAQGGPAKMFVWQGEGHSWDKDCTPGPDNQRWPCDQNQPHETVRFILNGTEIGRFVDHSPQDDSVYSYEFPLTLQAGQNELRIEHTLEGGSINSVFVKGNIFAQVPGEPSSCEDTPFIIEGRVINSCGAQQPILDITRFYQPRFTGAARHDGLPRAADGSVIPIDDTHWIDAVVPAIEGWSRESVVGALETKAQAEHRAADYYFQHPDAVTWALIIEVFGADRISGYYVHVADRDDNCGALSGTQGGPQALRDARWQFIDAAAQFEPTCDLPQRPNQPDVPAQPQPVQPESAVRLRPQQSQPVAQVAPP
ncbi:MAG TPA: hypothetical protein VFT99_02285, partial [Roseiflexaceae bacterium]|nr:hypothetical protein [Roseiflexaceae bacterium]